MNEYDYYHEGNNNYILKNYDYAIKLYSKGINQLIINKLNNNELSIKLYLNRSQCYLIQQLYELAISDCNMVLELDNNNIKALMRRAKANEYIGNYKQSYNDIHYIINNNLSIDKSIITIYNRLKTMIKCDNKILHSEGVPNKLVTLQQTLRLNIISSPFDDQINHLNYYTNYKFKICIGNEFGLWDHNIINEELTHDLPILLCNQLIIDSNIFDNDIQFDFSCNSVESNGKFYVNISFSSNNLSDKVIILKFSLDRMIPGNIHVVPVISLPMLIKSNESNISTIKDDISFLCTLNTSVQASCLRSIEMIDKTIYVLESPAYLGIGGKIWDSTYVLLDYLYKHCSHLIKDRRILELGCGTGLTGLGLSSLSPLLVQLTDLPEVIPLVTANIRINSLLNNKLVNYIALPLAWGSEVNEITSYDTIIASDVVYDPSLYEPLVNTLINLLNNNPRSVCILAHRHRHPEDSKFFTLLRSYNHIVVDEMSFQSDKFSGLTCQDVKIFHITTKSN